MRVPLPVDGVDSPSKLKERWESWRRMDETFNNDQLARDAYVKSVKFLLNEERQRYMWLYPEEFS